MKSDASVERCEAVGKETWKRNGGVKRCVYSINAQGMKGARTYIRWNTVCWMLSYAGHVENIPEMNGGKGGKEIRRDESKDES